jgi:hypothetical protein
MFAPRLCLSREFPATAARAARFEHLNEARGRMQLFVMRRRMKVSD